MAPTQSIVAEVERGVGMTIKPERNGPYLVSNVTTLTNSLGESLPVRPEMALCRCGRSRMKPFCDGSHVDAGFEGSKSPQRVPDHRVDYVGREVTIHDNRGTCCHAGNCTDHLRSVFREHQEPFVDPNGADGDAIIDIVRACPSGALSYSREGIEHRDVDRPPLIYVSKDGPYHVQGGIELLNEAFNEGASREHYALCRCGQSKNKPFCDGTHWWVKFVDENN
jgi:CDGSH-type Zn-finger protein/ferredoxin